MMSRYTQIAFALGALAAALMIGALGFQYWDGLPPCEMCMWQRYPHIAAAIIGLVGASLIRLGMLDAGFAKPLAWITLLLVALSGAIAVYHAGVEWHWWKGPSACTGSAFTGPLDLNAKVVMCDIAAWRLFGISLAGYNAIISLGAAALAAVALLRTEKTA
ncbi:MAG TPA: disulfide bond formation protein B [Rhizomicrobium sp.]|jgi:disulfide bond formation protein DsbB|nr:disulfide bond formation protein B [Rhizomicrobium sp.]